MYDIDLNVQVFEMDKVLERSPFAVFPVALCYTPVSNTMAGLHQHGLN